MMSRASDSPREACGLFGVFGDPDAAGLIYTGLFSQQHRGQEGAGIVVSDGNDLQAHTGLGLVSEVFSGKGPVGLPGCSGIGHVRYSTTGAVRPRNAQPLVAECVDGLWALAHNGNLTNAATLRRMYQANGAIFQTGTDSEVLVHLLADPHYRNRPRRVERALAELQGAFAFLLMNRDSVMAARDPYGFKPLVLGETERGGVVFASETCALKQVGARFVREIEPGELVCVDKNGLQSGFFVDPRPARRAQCVFEILYFARPDSNVFGANVHQARVCYGERLAAEHPVEADIVVSVPDSGNSAALGYARASGLPLEMGFIRNHYIGRTFIMPNTGERERGVDLKLAVLDEVLRDKRVIVVDDSIVRGTTARRRVARLRAAGAREVHMRVASPPIRHACFFGIDFPTREELIAAGREVDEIRDFIAADSLGYLSVDGLLDPFENGPERFCHACFTGRYPVDVSEVGGKLAFEPSGIRSRQDR